jgi:DNA-binding transcriptional regulator YiaG
MSNQELAQAVAVADLDERPQRAIAKAAAGNGWPARILALTRRMAVTQRTLAEVVGCHHITVCRWMRGRNVPTAAAQRGIAELERIVARGERARKAVAGEAR